MTLQTSGAISLGNIQTEFTGSNPISMSEYVRGGTYVPDTTTNAAIPNSTLNMSFSKFYGTARILDTQTVGVGSYSYNTGTIPSITLYGYGYTSSSPAPGGGAVGTITDGTSNIYSGATIFKLIWEFQGALGFILTLNISGATNSGWTNMIINGTTFTRASASSFFGGQWEWTSDLNGNPFGTSGNITVTWN